MNYQPGQTVIAYFRVAVANHRHEFKPFTGVIKSVSPKTARVEVNGVAYRIGYNMIAPVADSADLARANID